MRACRGERERTHRDLDSAEVHRAFDDIEVILRSPDISMRHDNSEAREHGKTRGENEKIQPQFNRNLKLDGVHGLGKHPAVLVVFEHLLTPCPTKQSMAHCLICAIANVHRLFSERGRASSLP